MTSEPVGGAPGLAVAAVLAREDGRYLLVRRAAGRPAAGYWTPVTGRPEPGEALEAALEREVFEEVGLRVGVGRELHRCPTEGAPYVLVWFEARLSPGHEAVVRPDAREVGEARWVSPGEALALAPLFEATRAFFRSIDEGG
jgi:8-oxo-dGTP diphosphatase